MTYEGNGVKIFVYGVPYQGVDDKVYRISSIDILELCGSPSLELRLGTFIDWMKKKEHTLNDILKYWGVSRGPICPTWYDESIWDETAYSRMKIEPLLGGGYRINMPYPEYRLKKKKYAKFWIDATERYASNKICFDNPNFNKEDLAYLSKKILEIGQVKKYQQTELKLVFKNPYTERLGDIHFDAESLEENDFIKLAKKLLDIRLTPPCVLEYEILFDNHFFEEGWKK